MNSVALICGGGIGGLAAALSVTRAGWGAVVFEQSAVFSEVGAGIQLGPNATRILRSFNTIPINSFKPDFLRVRSAKSGQELGKLELGDAFEKKYGYPYMTMRRADLHHSLLCAAQSAGTKLHAGVNVLSLDQRNGRVKAITDRFEFEGEAAVVADGVWSRLRQQILQDGSPQPTGHIAYRALVRHSDIPQVLRSRCVTVWVGSAFHVVSYPVCSGELINIVCILSGAKQSDKQSWVKEASLSEFKLALAPASADLMALLECANDWTLWILHDRAPLEHPYQMAAGRIALLGDASHPMRPYLAQGAAMSLEDAEELGLMLNACGDIAPFAFTQYATHRWQRNARVQARALRNGQIFHATGPVRWGRDAAMRLMGERLLDMPWLYGYRRST